MNFNLRTKNIFVTKIQKKIYDCRIGKLNPF